MAKNATMSENQAGTGAQDTDTSRPELDAFAAFMVAHGRLTAKIASSLDRARVVSLDLYDVLVTLEMAPDQKLTQSDLADRIVLSRSGLTRRIDRLEALGYVKREACHTDRRRGWAVLTDEGRKAREDAWPTLRGAVQSHFGSRMTIGEAKQLTAVMRRVIDSLEKAPD